MRDRQATGYIQRCTRIRFRTTPENQTRPAFPLFKYGYPFSHPDWVNNISYPPGYVIPYFQGYDGEGIRTFGTLRCGDRARSEALCLRQFPLSLTGAACMANAIKPFLFGSQHF